MTGEMVAMTPTMSLRGARCPEAVSISVNIGKRRDCFASLAMTGEMVAMTEKKEASSQ